MASSSKKSTGSKKGSVRKTTTAKQVIAAPGIVNEVRAEELAEYAKISAPVDASSENGEKAVVKAIASDNDILPFIIPLDPGVDSRNQWWERSINGHILRLQRGKRYDLPRYLVDFIEARIQIQRVSDESVSVFTSGNGARLNF